MGSVPFNFEESKEAYSIRFYGCKVATVDVGVHTFRNIAFFDPNKTWKEDLLIAYMELQMGVKHIYGKEK